MLMDDVPASGVDACRIDLVVLHLLGREHGLIIHNAPMRKRGG